MTERRTDAHSWSFDPERCQPVSVAAMPGAEDGLRYRQVPFRLPAEFRCPDRSGKVRRRKVRRAMAHG